VNEMLGQVILAIIFFSILMVFGFKKRGSINPLIFIVVSACVAAACSFVSWFFKTH
jgi:hypothetical protein